MAIRMSRAFMRELIDSACRRELGEDYKERQPPALRKLLDKHLEDQLDLLPNLTGEQETIMGVREIPKSYEYTCDCCDAKVTQAGDEPRFPNSTPPKWMTLHSMGNPLPLYRLLCESCAGLTLTAIDNVEPAKEINNG